MSDRKEKKVKRGQWDITETPDEVPDVSYIENPDVAHEESDVNVRGILWFVLGLGIATAVAFALMAGLYKAFEWQAAREEGEAPPMAMSEQERLPPEPRLQLAPGHALHPLEEMKQVRAEQVEELDTYAVIDEGMGTVRLPVKEAQRKLVESNPPAQPEQQQRQPPSSPTAGAADDTLFGDMPSQYSSGRAMEKRRQ